MTAAGSPPPADGAPVPPDGPLLPDRIHAAARAGTFGWRVFYYPETDSTNTVAGRLARGGEPAGTIVVAETQRAGRGRGDRRWSDAPGRDLLFSVILRPGRPADEVPGLTLAVGAVVAGALEARLGRPVGVKWPNDVVVDGRKLAGMLAEAAASGGRVPHVVLGVGLNVNSVAEDRPPGLRGASTSCRALTGRVWDRAELLGALLEAIEAVSARFGRGGFAAERAAFEARHVLSGRRVRFVAGERRGEGRVTGVDDAGRLCIETPGGGTTALASADVEVIG